MPNNRTIARIGNRDLSPSLADLAAKINTHHEQFERFGHAALECFSSGLGHARLAGELLRQAKAQIPHGHWLPWLEANCRIGDRQARKYMSIATADPQLLEQATKEHMTINRLVERIAEMKNAGKPKALPSKSAPGADLIARKSPPRSVAEAKGTTPQIRTASDLSTPESAPFASVLPEPQTNTVDPPDAAPPAAPQSDAEWDRLAEHDLSAYVRSLSAWANEMESLVQPYIDAVGPDIDQQPKSVRDAIHLHRHSISEVRWVRQQIRAMAALEQQLAAHCRRNARTARAEIQRIAVSLRDEATAK